MSSWAAQHYCPSDSRSPCNKQEHPFLKARECWEPALRLLSSSLSWPGPCYGKDTRRFLISKLTSSWSTEMLNESKSSQSCFLKQLKNQTDLWGRKVDLLQPKKVQWLVQWVAQVPSGSRSFCHLWGLVVSLVPTTSRLPASCSGIPVCSHDANSATAPAPTLSPQPSPAEPVPCSPESCTLSPEWFQLAWSAGARVRSAAQ